MLSNIYYLLIAGCIFLLGCKPSSPVDKANKQEEFEPTGDVSDLVYNPVRADGTIDSSFLPILQFEETVFDFGTIYESDVIHKKFTFKNTGTAPLLILKATSSCGCTIPEWPEVPIPPDSSGVILVKFDSANKEGYQNKEVSIFANTFPNKTTISVKGKVVKTK